VDLALKNTGDITFESLFVYLTDKDTGNILQLSSQDFINRDGCSITDTQADLPPSVTRTVSLVGFGYNPGGHLLEAQIDLYSNDNLSGTTLKQTITFTP